MHKDIPVLKFFSRDDFYKLEIQDIFSEKYLPIGICKEISKKVQILPDNERFTVWWKNRTIPSGRKNLEKALKLLNVKNKDGLLKKTHSLNLTDQYWVKKDNEDLKWSKINYFDNGFDDSIGEYLLLKRERTFSENSYNSPDLFTDGLLPKRWLQKDGKIYLIKGTDSTFQQEPFNEALATYLCHHLGINHVPYSVSVLTNDDGEKEYFSLCENFVTKDTEFISAYDITKSFKKLNNESYYQHFVRCCNSLGINDFEKELHKMLAIDFLMANTDRHLHNFGFIRDANTLEWRGLAPVYDTEKSLFLKKAVLKESYAAIDIEAKPFKDNQAEQFNLLNKDFLKGLDFSKVEGAGKWFYELLASNSYFSEERRKSLCSLVNNRIKSISYLIENDKKIPITKNKHRREIDRLQSLSLVVIPSL